MSIVGLVLLAIGLVKRNRASRNEPIAPPNDQADPGEQPRLPPPPAPSADD
jgi:hypothetical protein